MTAETAEATEAALQTFLARLPGDSAVHARSLAHGWATAGGELAVGSLAVRLVVPEAPGRPGYTAGTLYAPVQGRPTRLEIGRVLLASHGVTSDAWTHWSDENADLAHHGFHAADRFPCLELDKPSAAEVARLAMGLRDLAALAGG